MAVFKYITGTFSCQALVWFSAQLYISQMVSPLGTLPVISGMFQIMGAFAYPRALEAVTILVNQFYSLN